MHLEEQLRTRQREPRCEAPTVASTKSPHHHPDVDRAHPSQAAANLSAPTVFHEPWWLDVTTGSRFHVAEVHHGGRLVGSLPYTLSRRHGLRLSVMPPLTHLLGPAIDDGKGTGNTRWLRRLDIVKELIGQLPAFDLFSQYCHRAQERCQLQLVSDPHQFTRFYRQNLEDDGERSYFDLDLIPRVFEAAQARDRVLILSVNNAQKQNVASAFYVWDDRRLWYLLSSRNPAAVDNGAVSWLIWQGMREVVRRGLVFDFDGIFSMGSARFFSGFGASIEPRYVIRRQSRTFNLVTGLKMVLRGKSTRNHFTAD